MLILIMVVFLYGTVTILPLLPSSLRNVANWRHLSAQGGLMRPLMRQALVRLQRGQRRDRLAWLLANEQVRLPEGTAHTLHLAAQAPRLKGNRRHEAVR